MKKLWIFTAILTLCFALCACQQSAPTENPADPPYTTDPPAAEETTTYHFTVDTDTVSDSAKADDGEEIANCSYEIPTITAVDEAGHTYDAETVPDGGVAQAMKNFNRYYADWLENRQDLFVELTDMAKGAYAAGGGEWMSGMPFTDTASAVLWQSGNALSVELKCSSYTGGAHPNYYTETMLFDLTTGNPVALSDMVNSLGEFNLAVETEILAQIEDEGLAENYFEDYADVVKKWDQEAISFNDQGMNVTFAIYDLAPYAQGSQKFNISYDLLESYWNDYARSDLLGEMYQ